MVSPSRWSLKRSVGSALEWVCPCMSGPFETEYAILPCFYPDKSTYPRTFRVARRPRHPIIWVEAGEDACPGGDRRLSGISRWGAWKQRVEQSVPPTVLHDVWKCIFGRGAVLDMGETIEKLQQASRIHMSTPRD
ncbi:unnamed protein product [Ectocarpus sp. 8 AP-2014]